MYMQTDTSLLRDLGDLSLKEGSKIVVNSNLIKKSPAGKSGTDRSKGGTGNIILAPPPPPGTTVFAKIPLSTMDTIDTDPPGTEPTVAKEEKNETFDDDEFGDFETA